MNENNVFYIIYAEKEQKENFPGLWRRLHSYLILIKLFFCFYQIDSNLVL